MRRRSDAGDTPDPGILARLPSWAKGMAAGAVVALLLVPRACDRAPGDASNLEAASFFQAGEPTRLTSDLPALERFAEVAEVATEAVVRIESRMTAPPPRTDVPDMLEPFLGPGRPDASPRPRVAGGSGFIVSPDGRILTNAHVVEGGEPTVWLDDRRSFEAEIVGLDRTTDVAVLDIDATDLPALPLADSDRLRVGEWVLAIGSPGVGGGQLEQTVTSGIVSALGRPLQLLRRGLMEDPRLAELAAYAIENFIQTDAVINPGNSGGPLIDMHGRAVGINTAIASPTGYYSGYGFAVPANLARGVMEDLVAYGEVHRARLGVNVTTVTPEDAEFFGLEEVRGVLVQGAVPGGPAAEAGIGQGDVILSIDGDAVDRVGDLQQEVAERTPGDVVPVEIVRDRRRLTVDVELGRTDLPTATASAGEPAEEAARRLGMSLASLTPEQRSELGYDPSVEGALVAAVTPLSPADRKGIMAGSVIVEVDGDPVGSPAQAADRLGELEAGEVTALTVIGPPGTERLVTLRVPS